jgi:dTDP-4-dehydrorhamnose reductase
LLASVLKELAAGNKPAFPGLSRPGWWRRSTRLIHAEQQSTPSFEIEPTEANQIWEPPLLIAGGGGDLSALAIRACEMRGLPYVHCSEAEAEQLIVVVKPWAVLDVSDRDRVCSERDSMPRPKALLPIAAFCVAAGTPYAVITGAQSWHEVSHSAGVLEVRTHGVFVPWDRWARAVRMLDQLDQGRTVEIDPATSWTGVYGPDMIDVTLDLLFDGVTGAVDLRNRSQLSELDFARALAMVAEAPERLIQAEGSPAEQSLFSFSPPPSNLPPLSSMLERFVRECRCDCAIVGARYAAPAGSLVQAAE